MNSFTLIAVGNLAKDPEYAVKGDTSYARFCLVGNDYAGKDEHGNAREAVTSIWFTAFENLGKRSQKTRVRAINSLSKPRFVPTTGPIRRARNNTTTPSSSEFSFRRARKSQTRRVGRAARRERNRCAGDGDLICRRSRIRRIFPIAGPAPPALAAAPVTILCARSGVGASLALS